MLSPMSGINTPPLAAAVSRAGGLGSFGFAYSSPDDIWNDIAEARLLCSESPCPLNANFFIFPSVQSSQVDQIGPSVLKHLKQFPHTEEEDFQLPQPPYIPNLKTQLEPIWESRPEVITFHFGIPSKSILITAREHKILVGVTATSIQEAIAITNSGADFIIAQGYEAGGHIGAFQTTSTLNSLSLSKLVQSIRSHDITKRMPLVAAGGIMNGQDMHAMLHPEDNTQQGADVIQFGTAFLSTTESQAAMFKQHLSNITTSNNAASYERGKDDTVYTTAFTGRLARAISNSFITKWGDHQTCPFPVQHKLTRNMRNRATAAQDPEYVSLYAGINYRECRSVPVAELMEQLISEYNFTAEQRLIKKD